MTRRKYLDDRNVSSCLIYAALLCLSFFIVSGVSGSEGLFYAAGPAIAAEGLIFVSVVPMGSFVSRQIAYRLGRDRITDAFVFLHGAMLVQLLIGVVCVLVVILSGDTAAGWIFGSRYSSLPLYALAPGVVCGLLAGPLKGMLDGVGADRMARTGLYIAGAGTLVGAVIFSRLGRENGVKIGQLLLNDQYGSVYSGAGMCLGISCGWLMAFVYMGGCVLLVHGYYRRREAGLELREEQLGGIMAYYFRNVLLPFGIVLLVTGALLVDYRMGLYLYGGRDRTGFGLHWWDGFAGVALPVIIGTACLLAMAVSRLPGLCAMDYARRNTRNLRLRYAMMQRLCGYITIAASAFIFGAAKPIVQIVRRGLNAQARESAILTMKWGCLDVFLVSCCILVMLFFWKCGAERLLAICLLIAFGFQLLLAFAFMHLFTISIEALPVALAVFCVVFLIGATLLGWGSLMHATDLSWLYDDLLVLICAVVADIPVVLLNDFMTDEIIPIGGVILLLLLFLACFIPFSILLGAVDLASIRRLPGGRYIARLAKLMGR